MGWDWGCRAGAGFRWFWSAIRWLIRGMAGGDLLPAELLQPAAADTRCRTPVLQRSQHHGPRRRPRRHDRRRQQHDGLSLLPYLSVRPYSILYCDFFLVVNIYPLGSDDCLSICTYPVVVMYLTSSDDCSIHTYPVGTVPWLLEPSLCFPQWPLNC